MTKLRVNIFDCRCGDVIAKDVVSEKGLILAAENLVLNDFIISKLKTIGIKSVWIFTDVASTYSYYEKSRKEKIIAGYKETVLAVKQALSNIAAGKRFEFNTIKCIAESIYQRIDCIDTIMQYLNEIKYYDEYTYTHCVNVGLYSMLIGKRFNMPESKLIDLIEAGLLHDIGKIKIDNELLNKKGKLTDEEFATIKKHSSFGHDILNKSSDISEAVKEAVLMHHERLDGSGYPLGAKGDEIGEYAKIIAIADVYDAMTSDRPYKKRVTPFDAFHMFLTSGICEFDTAALNTFILNFSTHLVGSKVQLDNGDIGEVVYIPPHEIVNPIVRVGASFIKIVRSSGPQIVCFV